MHSARQDVTIQGHRAMVLTDYYRFEKTALKSKLRIDCTASTHSYDPLEERRAVKAMQSTASHDGNKAGDLFVYFTDIPQRFSNHARQKADKALTKTNNISSIYIPDPSTNLGYGDFKGTTDALLFVFSNMRVVDGRVQEGSCLEVFVARGKSHERLPLYHCLIDGELEAEMHFLRDIAEGEQRKENSPSLY